METIHSLKTQLKIYIEERLSPQVKRYLEEEKNGVYPIQANEPALVSQIKKVLNALVHAEKVIIFINSLDLNPDTGFRLESLLEKKGPGKTEFMVKMLWRLVMKDSVLGDWLYFDMNVEENERQFIDDFEGALTHIFEAQTSLLDIDIPIFQLFSQELQAVGAVITELTPVSTPGNVSSTMFQSTQSIAERVSENVAKPLGVIVDQLNPYMGKTDYRFITQQLGMMPGYLDQLTQLIFQYGAGEPAKALALTPNDRDALNASALRLFNELDIFQEKCWIGQWQSILFPMRKEVITLSYASYQQTLHVNEASSALVVYQLSRIKNDIFARIIAESDKVEQYFGYRPGTLANPLMQELNKIYQTLLSYGKLIVDLEKEHPDLLQLDNTSILTQRMQFILQEKKECHLHVQSSERAKHAIMQFRDKLDTAIEEDALHLFNHDEKAQLLSWYKQFESLVIENHPTFHAFFEKYISDNHSGEERFTLNKTDLDKVCDSLVSQCDKNTSTYQLYITMADEQLSYLPRQVIGHLYALTPHRSHSLLMIDEPYWVFGQVSMADPEVQRTKGVTKKHHFIDDRPFLTREQKMRLCDYYQIRVMTLTFILSELDVFRGEMSNEDWVNDRKMVRTIINQYRVLQPYIVDAISISTVCHVDEPFIQLLSCLSEKGKKSNDPTLLLENMKRALDIVKRQIELEIERSKHRQRLFEVEHKVDNAVIHSLQSVALQQTAVMDNHAVDRSHKWIRHQYPSRCSTAIRALLSNLLPYLDKALNVSDNHRLTLDEIPFPEMENDLEALATPSQVSWIKRIFNVMYYLDSNFKYLESLDRDVSQTDISKYVLKGPLVNGIYQIKPYINITKTYQTLMALLEEPAAHQFYFILKDALTAIQQVWGKIGPLYTTSSNAVIVDNPAPVQSNGIWYVLEPFLVMPEHFKALSKGEVYTAKHAEGMHRQAKELAQYIETIQNDYYASRYLALVMRSPHILFKLLPDIKEKINRFRTDIHQSVTGSLKEIQASLQAILIETDALEIKLGLSAGLISEPMQKILDLSFRCFIQPLGLHLHKKAELIRNEDAFIKRLTVISQQHAEISVMIKSDVAVLEKLKHFLQSIENINPVLSQSQSLTADQKQQFRSEYQSIYPLLKTYEAFFSISLSQQDKSIALDRFCQECHVSTHDEDNQAVSASPLKDVLYLVKHVHDTKLGNLNTLKMRLAQLAAQDKAIKTAKTQFHSASKATVLEDVEEMVDKKIEQLKDFSSQYQHVIPHFQQQLEQSLETKKQSLLQTILVTENVEKVVIDSLKAQYETLCHLDAILGKIVQFQLYCAHEKENALFEIESTLQPKLNLLNELKLIIIDSEKSPDERLKAIQTRVDEQSVKDTLLQYDQHVGFDLRTLKRLMTELLNSIFDWHPSPQKLVALLTQEISAPQPLRITHHTFFSLSPSPYRDAIESQNQMITTKPGG